MFDLYIYIYIIHFVKINTLISIDLFPTYAMGMYILRWFGIIEILPQCIIVSHSSQSCIGLRGQIVRLWSWLSLELSTTWATRLPRWQPWATDILYDAIVRALNLPCSNMVASLVSSKYINGHPSLYFKSGLPLVIAQRQQTTLHCVDHKCVSSPLSNSSKSIHGQPQPRHSECDQRIDWFGFLNLQCNLVRVT